MKCPVCTNRDLLMTDRQGVEIDYCPECRGVWLDRGELDKIIERTSAVQAPVAAARAPEPPRYPAPAPKHDRDHDYRDDKHHGYGKQHSKKSLLGDLFDF